MTPKDISDGVGNISTRHIQEAANYVAAYQKVSFFKKPLGRSMIAAVLALFLIVGGIGIFSPDSGMVLTAYAYVAEEEITSAGATFTTGTINDSGELTGHPLMFYLAGEGIETIRFSCKNEQINFVDLTEQRDEYGLAQNFTVPYGEDESEYSFLLIDWVPNNLISELKASEASTITTLPEEMRHDVIVMEVTFINGKSITKAITISLNNDGTFFAIFDDYTITDADNFVSRADSEAIPRDVLYEEGKMTVTFYDENQNAVLPEANWYRTENIDSIVVQWSGREPEMVQMFYTVAGTETTELMELLQTKVPASAENTVTLSAESLHRDSLMGHLQIVIDFGSSQIKSEFYNVIYDSDA